MVRKQQETVVCQICKEHKRHNDVIPFESIHGPLAERIKEMHPDSLAGGFVCISDLNKCRADYVRDILEKDKGELTTLDEQVMKSLAEHELLSKNTNIEFDQQLTFGEHLADSMADYAGSWRFIMIFMGILILWIIVNSVILLFAPVRSVPIHSSESCSFLHCCSSGSCHNDESKSPGIKGSLTS